MKPSRAPMKLPFWRALFITTAAWLVPLIAHMPVSSWLSMPVLREIGVTLAANLLAVALVAWAFSWAQQRGLNLVRAGVVAVSSAAPLLFGLFIFDWAFVSSHPELMVPTEPAYAPTLGLAVVQELVSAIALTLMMGSIVFVPLLASAHEERERELERSHRDAELLRLKSHLEPHFFLNSLNAVAGLVEDDPAQARELLANIGDLFRQASTFRTSHRVADEVDWLERYVAVHEIRHLDQLHAAWDIAEDCRQMECPAMILQPLVENAISHGALRGGGHLTVRAAQDGTWLDLVVSDDGTALGAPRDGGQGLRIVKQRLALEGLPDDSFRLSREGGLTVARVRLPVKRVTS